MEELNLREVMVFLAAAGIVVPLMNRFRVSPVLGFLVVGLLIGPYGLARFDDQLPLISYIVIDDLKGVHALAELGVVFLLFMIGLELSLDRLWAMRRQVFGLGGLQVVLTATAFAMIAMLFGSSGPVAVILGGCLALSSTAIVMQLLTENRRLGTATGRTAFAILLFQDLAVLPLLLFVGILASKSEGSAVLAFVFAMGQAVLAVAIILVLGRLVLRPLFRFVGSAASREMFLAFVLLVIIGTALVTKQAGLSMALGAFLAGLLFAETEYRHEIEVNIEPFKGLLLGLFFISFGMSIDLVLVTIRPLTLLAAVLGLFLIKAVLIYLLVRLFGQPRSVSIEAALLLGQSGEFAFVVIGVAVGLSLLPPETAQFILIVTSLAMIVTPLVAFLARRVARSIEVWEAERGQKDADLPDDIDNHIIIVGYGRVGQMLGSIIAKQGMPHIGLDLDAQLVARFRKLGSCVFFGDASRSELLKKFGADDAIAVVVTMDSPAAAENVVAAARKNWPELPIYARARDIAHARRLISGGASQAIPETVEASLQLGEVVLMEAGVPMDAAHQLIEVRRQEEQAGIDQD